MEITQKGRVTRKENDRDIDGVRASVLKSSSFETSWMKNQISKHFYHHLLSNPSLRKKLIAKIRIRKQKQARKGEIDKQKMLCMYLLSSVLSIFSLYRMGGGGGGDGNGF